MIATSFRGPTKNRVWPMSPFSVSRLGAGEINVRIDDPPSTLIIWSNVGDAARRSLMVSAMIVPSTYWDFGEVRSTMESLISGTGGSAASGGQAKEEDGRRGAV